MLNTCFYRQILYAISTDDDNDNKSRSNKLWHFRGSQRSVTKYHIEAKVSVLNDPIFGCYENVLIGTKETVFYRG